ncbi:F-box/SPRY domain-containing protein 1 isoform X2 [Patella vulgata]|nr:F-box/SPRY domain-containing protein 1 isoform X2 [Patella vulgata]
MGILVSTSHGNNSAITEVPPTWVCTLQLTAENNQDKLSSHSDGFFSANSFTVVRTREGSFHSDGARWSRGFTSGKHKFTIVYPETHRGTEASVGVGLITAPLFAKGRLTLVGMKRDSWGIDLRTRRAIHMGKIVKKYPKTGEMLPEKFYMYLDMESGTLQFASDDGYYGTAISGIKCKTGGEPVYPMLSAVYPGATINMTYNGEAIDPMLHQMNQQQQQMQQQAIYDQHNHLYQQQQQQQYYQQQQQMQMQQMGTATAQPQMIYNPAIPSAPVEETTQATPQDTPQTVPQDTPQAAPQDTPQSAPQDTPQGTD